MMMIGDGLVEVGEEDGCRRLACALLFAFCVDAIVGLCKRDCMDCRIMTRKRGTVADWFISIGEMCRSVLWGVSEGLDV